MSGKGLAKAAVELRHSSEVRRLLWWQREKESGWGATVGGGEVDGGGDSARGCAVVASHVGASSAAIGAALAGFNVWRRRGTGPAFKGGENGQGREAQAGDRMGAGSRGSSGSSL